MRPLEIFRRLRTPVSSVDPITPGRPDPARALAPNSSPAPSRATVSRSTAETSPLRQSQLPSLRLESQFQLLHMRISAEIQNGSYRENRRQVLDSLEYFSEKFKNGKDTGEIIASFEALKRAVGPDSTLQQFNREIYEDVCSPQLKPSPALQEYVEVQTFTARFNTDFGKIMSAIHKLNNMHRRPIPGFESAQKNFASAIRTHAELDIIVQKLNDLERVIVENEGGEYTGLNEVRSALEPLKILLNENNDKAKMMLKRRSVLQQYIDNFSALDRQWRALPHQKRLTARCHRAYAKLIRSRTARGEFVEQMPNSLWDFLHALEETEHIAKKPDWRTIGLTNRRVFKDGELQPLKSALRQIAIDVLNPVEEYQLHWETQAHRDLMPNEAHMAHDKLVPQLINDPDGEDVTDLARALLNALEKAETASKKRQGIKHRFKKGRVFNPGELGQLKTSVSKLLSPINSFRFQRSAIDHFQSLWNEVFPENPQNEAIEESYTALNNTLKEYRIERTIDKKMLVVAGADFLIDALNQSEDQQSNRYGPLKEALETAFIKPWREDIESVGGESHLDHMAMLQAAIKEKSAKPINASDTGATVTATVEPSPIEGESVETQISNRYTLLLQSWEKFENFLEVNKYPELQRETVTAWLSLFNDIHHHGNPASIKEKLDIFIKQFRQNNETLSIEPPDDAQCDSHATKVLELAVKHPKLFEQWCEKVYTKTPESFLKAIESFRNFPEPEKKSIGGKLSPYRNRGATSGKAALHPSVLIGKVAPQNVGVGGFLTQAPSKGGFDYFAVASDNAATAAGVIGFGAYHAVSLYGIFRTIYKKNQIGREGQTLQDRALQEIENIDHKPSNGERVKDRAIAEIAASMGETMQKVGHLSPKYLFAQGVDSVRRIGVIGTGIAGTALLLTGAPASAAIPVLAVNIALHAVGVGTTFNDFLSAANAASRNVEYEGMILGQISEVLERVEAKELALDKGVENVLRSAQSDKNLSRAIGVSMALLTGAYAGLTAMSAMGIATRAAEATQGLLAAVDVISKMTNIDLGILGLTLMAAGCQHYYRTAKMNKNATDANHAFMDFKNRNVQPEKFELYQKRHAKKVILNAADQIAGAVNTTQVTDIAKLRDVIRRVTDIRNNVDRQKFDPARQFGTKKSEWDISRLQDEAQSLSEQIGRLRIPVTTAYIDEIGRQVESLQVFREAPKITEALTALNEEFAKPSEIIHPLPEYALSINPLSTKAAAASKEILAKAIEVLNNRIPSVSNPGERRVLAKISLDSARESLENMDVLAAARHFNAALVNPTFLIDGNPDPQLQNLITAVLDGLKNISTIDALENQMRQIGQKSRDKNPESSGLFQLSSANVVNEMLLSDKRAFPAMLLWMLQNKDSKLAFSGYDMLRKFGADPKMLSNLTCTEFSPLTVNVTSQLLKTPNLVELTRTVPQEDLEFSAAWDAV